MSLKIYTPEEMKEIIAKHAAWIARMRSKHSYYFSYQWDADVDQVGRADLRSANLRSANLRSANLRSANLRSANLGGADLRSADLGGADLRSANLGGADLRSADLGGADLRSADLRSADLGGADLKKAILETGESYEKYLSEVVPALLTAGGQSVKAIVEEHKAWDCHDWNNCPMACAFKVHTSEEAPLLLRPRVDQFVRMFDQGLIPKPEIK